ncbi:MAG: helix-turn-helix domain-containing protein, partial [Opitutaceae bacterium]|nr:helix-turn-helix domain-containing protein [Opitutaceae bacterium]
MSHASKDLFSLRHELVRYATAHGIRPAMRQFGCSRNTVRLWLRRWQAGDESFKNHSRRPHRQPARTPATIEQA